MDKRKHYMCMSGNDSLSTRDVDDPSLCRGIGFVTGRSGVILELEELKKLRRHISKRIKELAQEGT